MNNPVTWDRWDSHVIHMTPLRERRLLQAAWARPTINHKAFYGQYCYLMGKGLVQWHLGTAFLTTVGEARLAELLEEGV